MELRVQPVPVVALVGQGKFQEKIKVAASNFGVKPLCYNITDPIAFSKPPKRLSYDGYSAKVGAMEIARIGQSVLITLI